MLKSFANRLAALEALEAEAEAEEEPLTDAEAIGHCIMALQSGAMHCWRDWQAKQIWICTTGVFSPPEVEEWLSLVLAPHVNPLVNCFYDAIAVLHPLHTGDNRDLRAAIIQVLKQTGDDYGDSQHTTP